MNLFGVNEFALRLPSVFLSTLSVFLTYVIGKKFFDPKVGWLAAFFHCVNGFVIEITGGRIPTDHIDVFFLFFIELAIVFAILQKEKNRFIFIVCFSIALACGILSKWLPALIVIPVWWLLNFEKGNFLHCIKQLAFALIIVLALVLPWQLYIFHVFPKEAKWESYYNWLHIVTVLEEHTGSWYFFLAKATIIWNELIWLAFIWFLWTAYQKHFPKVHLVLLVWITIPFIFFSIDVRQK